MRKIQIWSDGACNTSDRNGGYGAVLIENGEIREIWGGQKYTTNNRMELLAALIAIESLEEPYEIELVSDSLYVVNAIDKKWIYDWAKNDFHCRKNNDLWERMLKMLSFHSITSRWVRGHNGSKYNERADELAQIGKDSLKENLTSLDY